MLEPYIGDEHGLELRSLPRNVGGAAGALASQILGKRRPPAPPRAWVPLSAESDSGSRARCQF
jgi:hypothetical protein